MRALPAGHVSPRKGNPCPSAHVGATSGFRSYVMVIETLERRQLLSATTSVVGDHVLVVQLDGSGQTVAILETANGSINTADDTVQVVESTPLGGNFFSFNGIKAIVVQGGGGDDTIAA